MIFFILFSFIFSQQIQADTSTLPKGARAFIYKHITATVPGTFNSDGLQKDFSIREVLGPQIIKSISPEANASYEELKKISPEIAAKVNSGKINFDPKIDVRANVVGLAWGLTDKIMIATGVPMMFASVQPRGGYINDLAFKTTAQELRKLNISDESVRTKALAYAQVLEGLPTVTAENLQAVIVNDFKYKPVGNWSAADVGDATIFLQTKFLDVGIYKAGAKLGVDLPTGRTDDPDNLLDIPFGTGYTTTYAESINDFLILGGNLMFTLVGRYQHNWEANKTYRLISSPSFPLTADKENILYKPGNLFSLGGELSMKLWRSLGISANYIFKTKAADFILGNNRNYDYSLLESKTDFRSQTIQFFLNYSTVNSFLSKAFPVPFKIGLNYSYLLAGVNTEDVKQLGLDFEMYF